MLIKLDSGYLLNSDVFARAWVLGVWIVEETGEVTSYDD
jgi:hypothetical protein